MTGNIGFQNDWINTVPHGLIRSSDKYKEKWGMKNENDYTKMNFVQNF